MTKRSIRAATAAVLLAAGLATGPAAAGGTVTFSANAQGADAERALRAGLALYGLATDMRTNGRITQQGRDNAAGLLQNGRGNLGLVHQEGRDHVGTLEQDGDRNSYGLFQFGRGTRAHVRQRGDGGSGVTFQWGF
ncbi:curlin [Salinarimonas sp.]|uniref:curlin n=1 Tax=Salinarimonas sp. TaxID=2766526 RepID=UPI0032D8D2B9